MLNFLLGSSSLTVFVKGMGPVQRSSSCTGPVRCPFFSSHLAARMVELSLSKGARLTQKGFLFKMSLKDKEMQILNWRSAAIWMAGRIVSSFNSYNTILYHLKNWSKSSSTWQCHCDSCECHGDNVMSGLFSLYTYNSPTPWLQDTSRRGKWMKRSRMMSTTITWSFT